MKVFDNIKSLFRSADTQSIIDSFAEKHNSDIQHLNKQLDDLRIKQTYDLMEQKWMLIDMFRSKLFEEHEFHCIICESTINTASAKFLDAECIFKGGLLRRFECPMCGAVVGPLKMLNMDKKNLSDDYKQLYSVYSESDATKSEKFTFYQLNPDKNKRYLNYGCGAWSNSINELREEGYDVYGFEPYSSETSAPYIITSFDEVQSQKFDGIFSHNVIEHLLEPCKEFLFFKSLLKDKTSIMVHASPCYEYLYEFTRFHTIFYTGESLSFLGKRTGLNAFGYCKDIEQFGFPYISYKFESLH